PDHRDRFPSLPYYGHDRTGRDERNQSFIKRLALVLRVVLRRQLRCHPHQLQPHQLQATTLEPGDRFADQAALDAVRLDQDQRALHQEPAASVGRVFSRPTASSGQIRSSALPRMELSSMKPKLRESLEWLRLSPMTK